MLGTHYSNYAISFISEAPDQDLAIAISTALKQLLENEAHLFVHDASERAICAHLLAYLKPLLSNWDLDVEYNRNISDPKKVRLRNVIPDLIVHKRGSNDHNLLAVELKIKCNSYKKAKDIEKLQSYCDELGYKYGLFLDIDISSDLPITYNWVAR